MNDLSLFPADIAAMSVHQIAALPDGQLHEVHTNLDQAISWLKSARTKVDAALEQRFGDEARAALRDAGHEFGTVHLRRGALRLRFELPKKVTWDQKVLKAIAGRIGASGLNPGDYLETEFSVPESRYVRWPAVLQQQFKEARTVQADTPSFQLSIDSEYQP